MRHSCLLALLLIAAPCVAAQAATIDDSWVTVDGTIVHCITSGHADPGDPVLLMIHGWCGSADDFRLLLGTMPESLRCIAVDLPGCGMSAKPDVSYDPQYFQRFLDRLCDTLGLTRIMLVGHSLGGQVSMHFAVRRPDLVERLILFAPYGLEGEDGGWAMLARTGCFVDFCLSLNNRTFISWGLSGRIFYRPSRELVELATESTARSMLGAETVRALSRITRNLIGTDTVEPVLPGIRQPVSFIWGDRDQVLPLRWSSAYIALLPQARLDVVKGVGHVPMLEAPAESARLVVAAVAGREPQTAARPST